MDLISSLILILSFWECHINAHCNMQFPTPRGNVQFYGYCSRGWGCNTVCDSPKSASLYFSPYSQKTTVQRGGELEVSWLRQNHPGGFVRLAFSTLEDSDNKDSFDNNIAKYVCFETNCGETSQDAMLGSLNGPGSPKCSTKVKIPTNLPDGPITLQWTWFGGGVLYADKHAAFANYVSCSDLELKGGLPYDSSSKTETVFQGGDIANPGKNVCRYWSSNKVGLCADGAEEKNSCGYGPSKNGTPDGFY